VEILTLAIRGGRGSEAMDEPAPRGERKRTKKQREKPGLAEGRQVTVGEKGEGKSYAKRDRLLFASLKE